MGFCKLISGDKIKNLSCYRATLYYKFHSENFFSFNLNSHIINCAYIVIYGIFFDMALNEIKLPNNLN